MRLTALGLTLCVLSSATALRADEGMWTFDNLPAKQLKEKHGFVPSATWLEHLRLASVRFNDGGSGSFVSSGGLVLTNHHVAREQLQKMSGPKKDFVKDGFLAGRDGEEVKCPDLELNVLQSMEDVTAKVMAAVKPGMAGREALDARKAMIGKLEKESLDATGLRSDVVSLYQGGEYWLYRYKKYTDVRLAFAPEAQAAFYGGDPDNFTFPRFDVDMALFRVYENGKPVKPAHHLTWNPKGAGEGDLVFISGHPGSTQRRNTVAQLEFSRDLGDPMALASMRRMMDVARRYGARGPEEARQVGSMIFGLENGFKAIFGELEGLKAPGVMAKKIKEETELRRRVDADPALRKAYGGAWEDLAKAQALYAAKVKQLSFRTIRGGDLPGLAMTLVRFAAEVAKPDGERLEEYHEAGLESVRFQLLSPAPTYPAMEQAFLEDRLKQALEELGPDDVWVKAALAGKTPEEAAKAALAGTRVGDPAFRKALMEGGVKAVEASTDPLILLALRLDPLGREMRKWYMDTLESVETTAGEKIGKAMFAVHGRDTYPDATFTLRLSYGTIKGYPMNGTVAPSKTTFMGLYDRAASFDNKAPFDLPLRAQERKDKLDLATPLNFVCDGDIIGGNSGSPVVNRAGELVGLIFDGNIESLAGNFVYDGTANRAVAVHSAGMTEALLKLYDAEALVKELTSK
jgi:hypothetical protein